MLTKTRITLSNCLATATAVVMVLSGSVAMAEPGIELLQQRAKISKLLPHSIVMATLNSVNSVVAVGERGHIFSWKNHNNWQQHKVPVSVALTSVTQLSDGTMVAVGHDSVILTSAAGSNSWHKVFDGNELLDLKITLKQGQIAALQQTIATVLDDVKREELSYQLEELIFSHEDAQLEKLTGPNKPLLSVTHTSQDILFASGAYGTLLISKDKGQSWQLIEDRIENPQQFHLNQVVATNDDRLFLVGENGIGFKSDDLGKHWTVMSMPYAGSLFGIVAQPNSHLLVAFGLQGNLLLSHDNGTSWQHKKLATSASLLGGAVSQQQVYLVGHGGLVIDFNINDFERLNMRRHPSGAAFTSVTPLNDELVLGGQFGITAWSLK